MGDHEAGKTGHGAPPHQATLGRVPDAVLVALLKSLQSCLMFLEYSHEDQLDPDWALKGLEAATYELLKLSAADRARLVEFIREVAEKEDDESSRAFLLSMPFANGLTEDAPPARDSAR
jgi:hypothetical protein